ncbi:PREDICTED: LOW QUALITY PROTEIN: ATP-dependent RNA helicase DDX1-like [Priapulus caudatus]|uniref:ATP-dependent RNA helicase n=1 Tax=Priapulus caudatus TaxID=37621 RepID=A0ABM1DXJ7_PRICU|nr:PREDICTED: LOW QUALITY PROTEIN: ATP-dependent RNA helicase DDX1-like [Priapulus caudatus]
MTAFEEFGVLPELSSAVEEMGWLLPTDVQAEAIPLILGGGDVLMAAETGSGKTGAFCLPVLQIVHETLTAFGKGKSSSKTTAKSAKRGKVAMNSYDRGDAMAIDPEGLLCQSREQQSWHGCRSTVGVSSVGKYYYEASVSDEGLCRVGWSTMKATLDLGTDKESFGYGGTGKKSFGRQFDSYGEPYGMNDTIGCCLNLDEGVMKYLKNGKDLGDAFVIPKNLQSSAFFAAVVLKNAEMKFNFGGEAFKFPLPPGYTAFSRIPKEQQAVSGTATAAAVSKPAPNAPQAIIIEPSRELAEQTYDNIQKFKKHLKSSVPRDVLVIGGVSVQQQLDKLFSGVDIVCATPGRLEDFISTEKLLLSQVRFFILDEADGLLAAGYKDMIMRLHRQIPKVTADGQRLQMIVCSATLHSFEVKNLANTIMHFPTWVDLKGEDSIPETVHHVVCKIDPTSDTSWQNARRHVQTDGIHAKDNLRPGTNTPETLSEAVKLLKADYVVKALRTHKMDQALIFCRTKVDCDNLENYIKQLGGKSDEFSCVCLHGDRKPHERKANLEAFKVRGYIVFNPCTDVAGTCIDVQGIPFVVNVTLPPPDEKANYLHRIERVGRAERMGLAISLVSAVPEKVWYHGCPSRGKSCNNSRLTSQGGCAIWYNEPQYLADIEEHLLMSISQIPASMEVAHDEFDGKVTYGQKRQEMAPKYKGHVEFLAPMVAELAAMEQQAQTSFLNLQYGKPFVRS